MQQEDLQVVQAQVQLVPENMIQEHQDPFRIPGPGLMGEWVVTVIKPADLPFIVQVTGHKAKPVILWNGGKEGLSMILPDALHRPGLQVDGELPPYQWPPDVFIVDRTDPDIFVCGHRTPFSGYSGLISFEDVLFHGCDNFRSFEINPPVQAEVGQALLHPVGQGYQGDAQLGGDLLPTQKGFLRGGLWRHAARFL